MLKAENFSVEKIKEKAREMIKKDKIFNALKDEINEPSKYFIDLIINKTDILNLNGKKQITEKIRSEVKNIICEFFNKISVQNSTNRGENLSPQIQIKTFEKLDENSSENSRDFSEFYREIYGENLPENYRDGKCNKYLNGELLALFREINNYILSFSGVKITINKKYIRYNLNGEFFCSFYPYFKDITCHLKN